MLREKREMLGPHGRFVGWSRDGRKRKSFENPEVSCPLSDAAVWLTMTKRNAFLSVFGFFVAWMRKLSKTKDRSKVQKLAARCRLQPFGWLWPKTRFFSVFGFVWLGCENSRRRHNISGAGLSWIMTSGCGHWWCAETGGGAPGACWVLELGAGLSWIICATRCLWNLCV